MGASISRFWLSLFGPKQINILILGQDYAGKTTILYKLNLQNSIIVTIPALGFVTKQASYRNIHFTVFDLLAWKFGLLYKHYYENVQGIIFVVDSTDDVKDCYTKEELNNLLNEEKLIGVPILIFANKQDLACSMSVNEIKERLELDLIRGRNWFIQGSSFLKGEGLKEGLDWLLNAVLYRR